MEGASISASCAVANVRASVRERSAYRSRTFGQGSVCLVNDLIGRHLQALGEGFLDIFPAVVIQGARQVGKSTFAQMLTAERPHTRLSLDDDDVREAALADPRAFAAQAGAGTLVIDEIQRAPSLLLAIKSAIGWSLRTRAANSSRRAWQTSCPSPSRPSRAIWLRWPRLSDERSPALAGKPDPA